MNATIADRVVLLSNILGASAARENTAVEPKFQTARFLGDASTRAFMSQEPQLANPADRPPVGRFSFRPFGHGNTGGTAVVVWCSRCGLEETGRRQRDLFSRGSSTRHKLAFARPSGPSDTMQDGSVRVICDHCLEVTAD